MAFPCVAEDDWAAELKGAGPEPPRLQLRLTALSAKTQCQGELQGHPRFAAAEEGAYPPLASPNRLPGDRVGVATAR